MEFEWDEDKNRANRLKHGIAFEDALVVFDDPNELTEAGRAGGSEIRFQTMGVGPFGLMLFVVHTERRNAGGRSVIRIISARRASREERLRYERR